MPISVAATSFTYCSASRLSRSPGSDGGKCMRSMMFFISICSRIGFCASAASWLARFSSWATLSGCSAARFSGFRSILRDVVQLDGLRQQRVPDQLPIALADGSTERLDIVDELRARRGLAFADRPPDVHAVERLVLAKMPAGKIDERRIEINRVDHLVDAGLP